MSDRRVSARLTRKTAGRHFCVGLLLLVCLTGRSCGQVPLLEERLAACRVATGSDQRAGYERLVADGRQVRDNLEGPERLRATMLLADALSEAGRHSEALAEVSFAENDYRHRNPSMPLATSAQWRSALDWRLAAAEWRSHRPGRAFRLWLRACGLEWLTRRTLPLVVLALWLLMWQVAGRRETQRRALGPAPLRLLAITVLALAALDVARLAANLTVCGSPAGWLAAWDTTTRSALVTNMLHALTVLGLARLVCLGRDPSSTAPPCGSGLGGAATRSGVLAAAAIAVAVRACGPRGIGDALANGAHMVVPVMGPTLLVTALLGPAAEEALFRGRLFESARASSGAFYAVVSTALAFAAYHGDSDRFGALFFAGIVYGTLRELTGSLPACISVHAVTNLLARCVRA